MTDELTEFDFLAAIGDVGALRYVWCDLDAGGWAIRDGVSHSLIAEGPEITSVIGWELLRKLNQEHRRISA